MMGGRRWLFVLIRMSWVLTILVTAGVCWGMYAMYGDSALPRGAIIALMATILGGIAWIVVSMVATIIVGNRRTK